MPTDPSTLWVELAGRLGLRVTAPFSLIDSSGVVHRFDAWFHDFGAANEMLLFTNWDQAAADAALASGHGFSCVSP